MSKCHIVGNLMHWLNYFNTYCDLCTVYVSSECCDESAPATMALLCNYQWVVSMRQKMLPVHRNKIPQKIFLLVYQETNSINHFWMVFNGNMITAALRLSDFPQFRQSQ